MPVAPATAVAAVAMHCAHMAAQYGGLAERGSRLG
jgi:hypothetical protein